MDPRSLQDRFRVQVTQTPNAVAVSSDDVRLTYRELDAEAERFAQRLRELGAAPEVPVAVLMERSVDLVVATLAVVKSGAYYVPLHTAYPPARLQRIVDQLGGPVLVTDAAMRARGVPSGCRAVVDPGEESRTPVESSPVPVREDNLAYVLHTSGTSGEPKGVAVPNRDVLALALDRSWDGGAHRRVLMVAPYAFSMSTYELWVPLLNGGCIILPPAVDLDVDLLQRFVTDHDPTVVHLTAGLFRVVAEEAPKVLAPLREVMTGGDVISPAAVAKVLDACPGLVVRATYGAAETALFTTNHVITAPYEPATTVPVGRPMDGVRCYLLDANLSPVPAGTEGEMYVAGAGVARGYSGRPDLTAERFVPDPFTGSGNRMYRTGDLARWTRDGMIDLLGRADQQIKIRGFRVEPTEVEAALRADPRVADAAVIARGSEGGDKRLLAYLVPRSDDVDLASLREHLTERLPDFMLPSSVVAVDRLPLTPNGKLDHAALFELRAGAAGSNAVSEAALDPLRKTLCSIFADVLEQGEVGVDDDFFDLSGQSMQAIRLTLRISDETGSRVTIPQLYDNSTPGLLAEFIEQARQAAAV